MQYFFLLNILVVGLSGIVAQILILRELLVSFYGNELSLGIILANWVLLEALGVFIIGKLIDKAKDKISVFIVLETIFSLLLPVSIYIARTFKGILGIPFGEAIGLYPIFWASFFIILPIGFCHGALFSAGCRISPLLRKDARASIGRVYSWEALGTIIGGIILTYLFIPNLNSFQSAFIISLSNLIIAFVLLKYITGKKLRYINFLCIILASFSILIFNPMRMQRVSLTEQWKGLQILGYRNSVYGNILAAKKEEQYTFFYNGSPIITTPYPDITFVEEFGHLPLLFHQSPKDILIISSGAGGIINEVLKHPIKRLDYAELDPLIIETLKDYPTELTTRELSDPRVKVINLDGRFFLRTTDNHYDVVLIGLSRPADLSTNRLFTQEFFSLVEKRLNPGGILALWLPGSLTYLSEELRDLNACIFNALKNTYAYVRIIPGDYNIFLASGSGDIWEASPALIAEKLSRQDIKTNILTPAYLDYRLNKKWLEWYRNSSVNATPKANLDLRPLAVFEMLVFWNKQFSPRLARSLRYFQNLDLKVIAVLILIITLIILYIIQRRRSLSRFNIVYSIATTGFFGMLVNLILIFSFQVFYGYLYHQLGLLISIFMAGIALGSIYITRHLENIQQDSKLFIKLELAIIIFTYLLALGITKLSGSLRYSFLIFIGLFFISGVLMGLEFPLASKIYLKNKQEIGQTAGLLYCADLIGGWLAGLCAGIIFLPILGLFNACIVIVMLKLSSLILLIVTKEL